MRRGRSSLDLAKCAPQHQLAFFRALPSRYRAPIIENLAEVADGDVHCRHEIDFNMVGVGSRGSVIAESKDLRSHAVLHESHSRQNVGRWLTGGIGCGMEQGEARALPRVRCASVIEYRLLWRCVA